MVKIFPSGFLKCECFTDSCAHTICEISLWYRPAYSSWTSGPRLERAAARREQLAQRVHHVVDLALGLEDQARAVREVRARPVQAEEVREVLHRDAEVRGRLVAPLLAEDGTVAAGDVHRPEEVVVAEPGGVTDDVGGTEGAVDGDHAVGHDALDAGAHELDVVLPQAGEPRAVVLQHALGGGGIVGDRLGLELGVVTELRAHELGEHVAASPGSSR